MTAPAVQAETKYRSVRQLADYLNVSKWTIYRRYQADGWPHSRCGGIKFSDDDVAEIEERIRQVAARPPEPRHSAKQMAKAAERLGLPAPRRGS